MIRTPWTDVAEAGVEKFDAVRASFARACKNAQAQATEVLRNCNGFAEGILASLQEHHKLQQQLWRRHHPIGGLAVRDLFFCNIFGVLCSTKA
jgi:hypothetical protein